jgi:nucleoside-diphosphate-sugar epimerase
MESILVTGGAGFIGSNIVDALVERRYNVVVLDDLSTGHKQNIAHHLKNKALTFYEGSILDSGLVRDIMKRHDISRISHQAAVASVTKCVQDPVATSEVNIIGTINLFDIAGEHGCKRIVFASSCAIYGDTDQLPIGESLPVNAKSPYAAAKASNELLAQVFRGLHGTEIVALRYFNVYGQRQDPASDYAAVIPKFITLALENKTIQIEGDGMQTRDFIYIDDIVKANLLALTKETVPGTVFNIACGGQTSVLVLAKKIIALSGSQSMIAHFPPRKGDIRASHADVEKARVLLDFTPEHTIDTGLMNTLAWYRQQAAVRNNLPQDAAQRQSQNQFKAAVV